MATLAEKKARIAELMAEPAAEAPATMSLSAKKARIAELQANQPKEISQGESAVRGAAQGLTLGWADELMGHVAEDYINLTGNAGLFDDPYAQAREEQGIPTTKQDIYKTARDSVRQDNAAAQDANPITYAGAELVGSAAPAVVTGGASTVPQAMLKAGAYGATLGAGKADEAEDMTKDAIMTGGTAALTGGLLKGGAETTKLGYGLLEKVTKKASELGVKITPGDVLVTTMGGLSGGTTNAVTALAGKRMLGPLVEKSGASNVAQAIGSYVQSPAGIDMAGKVAAITKEVLIENPKELTKILQDKVKQAQEARNKQ